MHEYMVLQWSECMAWTKDGRQTLHPVSKKLTDVRFDAADVDLLIDMIILLDGPGSVGVYLGDNKWASCAWL